MPYPQPGLIAEFVADVSKTPLLTLRQEQTLARRIARGGKTAAAARNALVQANLRLVLNIAAHYHTSSLSLEDRIQEGNSGLVRAAEMYDLAFGTRFSTYATWWIKQSIHRAVDSQSRMIRLPAHSVNWKNKYTRMRDRLRSETHSEPTPDEICQAIGAKPRSAPLVKQSVLVDAMERLPERRRFHRAKDKSIIESMPDEHSAPLEDALIAEEYREQIAIWVAALDEREALVVRLRFGLDGNGKRTLDQIGEKLGVTRERVRKIQLLAMQRLRLMAVAS